MGAIDNIDKFGNCVVCHRNLVKNVVLNGKVEGVFDGDKDEVWMKMSNGSLMSVCVCRPCKNSMDFNDPIVLQEIDDACHNGWALEIDHMNRNPDKFPDWTPAKKEALEGFYAGLSITGYEKHHKVGV